MLIPGVLSSSKLQFGKTYAIHASVAQSVDITKGATVTGNFHIEKIVPFKFSCPACGATCSIKVRARLKEHWPASLRG